MKRVEFRFDNELRCDLLKQLVLALRPPKPTSIQAASLAAKSQGNPQAVAEGIVGMAEEQINLLLSGRRVDQEADQNATPATAPNIGEAIKRLRESIKPFREGWVDPRTAGIADWSSIDARLVERMEELEALPRRKPDEDVRYNAEHIFLWARELARHGGFDLDEKDALSFVAAVLEAAELPHPNLYEHPTRFREFILGDDPDPTTDGETTPLD